MRNILEAEATSVADLQFKSCNNGKALLGKNNKCWFIVFGAI